LTRLHRVLEVTVVFANTRTQWNSLLDDSVLEVMPLCDKTLLRWSFDPGAANSSPQHAPYFVVNRGSRTTVGRRDKYWNVWRARWAGALSCWDGMWMLLLLRNRWLAKVLTK